MPSKLLILHVMFMWHADCFAAGETHFRHSPADDRGFHGRQGQGPEGGEIRRWQRQAGADHGVLLLAALGVAGYSFFAYRQAAPVDGPAAAASAAEAPAKLEKDELYLPLDPPFVVNFQGEDTLRYLQVGVTLGAHDQKAIDAAKAAQPALRDALVALFSNQQSETVGTPAGREKLQKDALAAVRKIIKPRLGRDGIEALYFTSFVMQ